MNTTTASKANTPKRFKKTLAQAAAVALAAGIATDILLYGGSRSGKTFILVYLIVYRALKAAGSRHAILRRHFNTVKRSIVFDTFPKVMQICFPDVEYILNKTDWFVVFPNGSEIWFGGLDDKDRVDKILGNEYATIWFNECSEISEDSVTTALTRLAQRTILQNRVYYDCNPPSRRHWVYKMFKAEGVNTETHASMKMNPEDNADNIAPDYIARLKNLPAAKRKRFLAGEFADEVEGALWKQTEIDSNRVTKVPKGVHLVRVVVALDPSCTSTGDEAGIIVVGLGSDGHYYVLDDASLQGSPATWAREAVTAYERHQADMIVYEKNQGGEMVEGTLAAADPNVPTKAVWASRGKIPRARPVSARAEHGEIHHVGFFPELEDELTQWKEGDEDSPNRLDAMVWAVTELMGGGGGMVGGLDVSPN